MRERRRRRRGGGREREGRVRNVFGLGKEKGEKRGGLKIFS